MGSLGKCTVERAAFGNADFSGVEMRDPHQLKLYHCRICWIFTKSPRFKLPCIYSQADRSIKLFASWESFLLQ